MTTKALRLYKWNEFIKTRWTIFLLGNLIMTHETHRLQYWCATLRNRSVFLMRAWTAWALENFGTISYAIYALRYKRMSLSAEKNERRQKRQQTFNSINCHFNDTFKQKTMKVIGRYQARVKMMITMIFA